MRYGFTSLQATIEKLLEAEYFLAGMTRSHGAELGYNLNAFLAACRSVTFVMQKSLSKVAGFDAWYDSWRRRMKADPAMGFFLELRNISQHEGPVSMSADRFRIRRAGPIGSRATERQCLRCSSDVTLPRHAASTSPRPPGLSTGFGWRSRTKAASMPR
jgi:hypothetical protein